MNYESYKITFLSILTGILLTACASPTIRKNIDIRSFAYPEVSSAVDITDAYMIGGNGADWAEKIICSQDSSYILFGETIKSFGESTDFLAVKVSSDHKILWAKTYGGPHKDLLHDVIPTIDRGYLMLGSSQSLFFTPLPGNKAARPFLVKTTRSGDPQWAITLEGIEGSLFTILTGVMQAQDGGYLLTGQSMIATSKDTFKWNTAMVKLTQNGEPLWAYCYDEGINDIGKSIAELPDGSLFICGYTLKDDDSNNDFIIIKTDANGRPLWAKSYYSDNNLYTSSLLLLENDGLLVMGGVNRSTENTDFFAAKVTFTGEINWSNAYGSPTIDQPVSMIKNHSDEYIITGRSGNADKGFQDGVAIIIDKNGNLKTSSFIGGSLNDDLRSASILPDGKYCIALSTSSFQATYVDILTAIWTPIATKLSTVFSETRLALQDRKIDVKIIPVNYRYVPLSVKHNLDVKQLSTETKKE